jgi:diketogulonate reductase-like aldo/keto reductase
MHSNDPVDVPSLTCGCPDPAVPPVSRRDFLRSAAIVGVGAAGVALAGQQAANAQQQAPLTPPTGKEQEAAAGGPPPDQGGSEANIGINPDSGKKTGALGSSAPGPRAPRAVPTGSDLGEGAIPMRALGKTGAMISALGCGGHHLGDAETVNEAMDIVHQAVDYGITFFDNCWEYHNGRTEDWLGRALVGGRRERVFLMTKVCTHGRSADLAMKMLEESLRRLQTDHVDLWQIHGVTYDDDPELAYARGGVIEALQTAKQQGKTRFVGFTGHKDPGMHLRMLEMGFPFDTVQMPLNPLDYHFFSFERQVLPEAERRGVAVLGMKSMGGTASAVKQGLFTAEEMLCYAMSLPVATTISGMESLDVLHQNLRVARGFTPLGASDMEELRARCAPVAADGRLEPYKVSLQYDNPLTRMPHGFPFDAQQREVQDILQRGMGLSGSDTRSLAPLTP